jgi:hypothetical protein
MISLPIVKNKMSAKYKWLVYHKNIIINVTSCGRPACKKMSFIHFRFSDILFSLYVRYFKFIKAGLTMFRSNFTTMSFCLIIIDMLIITGDVELNPGPGETPVNFEDHCLSIFHGNIRSLRNEVDYISNIIED